MIKTRILLAEDDLNLGHVTTDFLEISGYEVVWAKDGELAWQKFVAHKLHTPFDICLLDVMMPKKDGFELAKDIRTLDENVPILFITAKSLGEDKVLGFRLGADDYITKPFDVEELMLRIEVFLRRSKVIYNNPSGNSFLSNNALKSNYILGKYTFDHENFLLTHEEFSKKLTKKEANVLQKLIENQGNIVKREDLLEDIWGKNDYFLGRSLDVFIAKLRKYIALDTSLEIENHHGIGFKLIVKNL